MSKEIKNDESSDFCQFQLNLKPGMKCRVKKVSYLVYFSYFLVFTWKSFRIRRWRCELPYRPRAAPSSWPCPPSPKNLPPCVALLFKLNYFQSRMLSKNTVIMLRYWIFFFFLLILYDWPQRLQDSLRNKVSPNSNNMNMNKKYFLYFVNLVFTIRQYYLLERQSGFHPEDPLEKTRLRPSKVFHSPGNPSGELHLKRVIKKG